MAEGLGANEVVVHVDSQVIVNQVTGQCQTKGERLRMYLRRAWEWRNVSSTLAFDKYLRKVTSE